MVGAPRLGKPPDGLGQHVLRRHKVQPQVVLALPGGVEPASRQHRDAVPQRRLRERGPVAVGQAHPQGLAAWHRRRVPVRQAAGQLGAQVVVPGLPPGGLAQRQRIQPGHQLGRRELRGDVAAEVIHGEQPGQPGDQRLGGAHPPDAQAAPDALAERADRDHGAVIAGQRRRNRRPGKPQIARHLVVDQRDPGRGGRVHQCLPVQRRQHRAGRVVEGGDHIRHRGALPARRGGEAGEPDRKRTRHRRLLPERLERSRVGGPFHQHPVARRQQRAGQQRQRLLAAVGDHDLFRPGADSAPGVPVRDGPAQRRVAGRVVADIPGGVRQRNRDPGVRLGHLGRWRVRGGTRERDHVVTGLQQVQEHRRAGGLARAGRLGPRDPGAAALAPDDPPVLTEQVVRGDHGASADRESQREGPVRRQRLARRQLALVDQPPQPRRQQHVQRPAARRPPAQTLGKLNWLHMQTNSAALALPAPPRPGKHGWVTTRQPDEGSAR